MALNLFEKALARRQDVPNIWMHYGACLHDTHQYDEARACFQRVNKLLPQDPMPIANMAAGYIQQGRAREANEWADRALAMDPNHGIAKVAKSFACLALGRWADGWKYADSLYTEKVVTRSYSPKHEPAWDGTKGLTVVVQADQGLGDMIHFSQVLPEMARDCKQVIVETHDRMAGLFRRSFPTDEERHPHPGHPRCARRV